MSAIRRVLHPSDFSPASRAAFEKAVELARGSRAELLVVHVLASVAPIAGDGYISPQAYDEIERSIRAQGTKDLDAVVRRARKAGVRATGLLLEGAPDVAITRAARAKRADMIVMGTHGRRGFAKFFLGSVASRVVATAACPVLTVRGR
jgi:nucleotide-binding universal stress UspA family protein